MKTWAVGMGAFVVLVSSILGGVQAMDSRYARQITVQNIEWTLLKQQIRGLRRDIRENPADDRARDELDAAIDRLCRIDPQDRDCER